MATILLAICTSHTILHDSGSFEFRRSRPPHGRPQCQRSLPPSPGLPQRRRWSRNVGLVIQVHRLSALWTLALNSAALALLGDQIDTGISTIESRFQGRPFGAQPDTGEPLLVKGRLRESVLRLAKISSSETWRDTHDRWALWRAQDSPKGLPGTAQALWFMGIVPQCPLSENRSGR